MPDRPGLLDGFDYIDKPTTDLIQERFLNFINVKTSWTEIKDADYIKIGSFYYTVSGIEMVAADVARISLLPDYITSAGGISAIHFLDGITERIHVSNDGFGLWDEPDPLTTPSRPLILESGGMKFAESPTTTNIVESTVDLGALGNGTAKAVTYTDAAGREVTVPSTPQPTASPTAYAFADGTGTLSTVSAGTWCYTLGTQGVSQNVTIQAGIQKARDLGGESSIISQVQYPSNFVTIATAAAASPVPTITGRSVSASSDLPIDFTADFGTTIRNKRLLYGEQARYKLLTASGDSAEFLPEDIADSTSETPDISAKADPRPDARPYFRFTKYLGNETGAGFWINAIPGMRWKSVPLIYYQKSGNILDTVNFEASSRRQAAEQTKRGLETAAGATGAIIAGSALGPAGLIAGGLAAAKQIGEEAYQQAQFQMAHENELYNYGYSQSVVAPTVQIPFETETIRDFYGNGCFVFRYHPSEADCIRIDRLLTMYGYRVTKQLTQSDLTNRQYFNYVQASGVSIGGQMPTWHKNGIAMQMRAGVRIWHTAPAVSHYTNNPIV